MPALLSSKAAFRRGNAPLGCSAAMVGYVVRRCLWLSSRVIVNCEGGGEVKKKWHLESKLPAWSTRGQRFARHYEVGLSDKLRALHSFCHLSSLHRERDSNNSSSILQHTKEANHRRWWSWWRDIHWFHIHPTPFLPLPLPASYLLTAAKSAAPFAASTTISLVSSDHRQRDFYHKASRCQYYSTTHNKTRSNN